MLPVVAALKQAVCENAISDFSGITSQP